MSRRDTREDLDRLIDKRFPSREFRRPDVPTKSQKFVRDMRSRPTDDMVALAKQAVDAGRSRKVAPSSPKLVDDAPPPDTVIKAVRYGDKF